MVLKYANHDEYSTNENSTNENMQTMMKQKRYADHDEYIEYIYIEAGFYAVKSFQSIVLKLFPTYKFFEIEDSAIIEVN